MLPFSSLFSAHSLAQEILRDTSLDEVPQLDDYSLHLWLNQQAEAESVLLLWEEFLPSQRREVAQGAPLSVLSADVLRRLIEEERLLSPLLRRGDLTQEMLRLVLQGVGARACAAVEEAQGNARRVLPLAQGVKWMLSTLAEGRVALPGPEVWEPLWAAVGDGTGVRERFALALEPEAVPYLDSLTPDLLVRLYRAKRVSPFFQVSDARAIAKHPRADASVWRTLLEEGCKLEWLDSLLSNRAEQLTCPVLRARLLAEGRGGVLRALADGAEGEEFVAIFRRLLPRDAQAALRLLEAWPERQIRHLSRADLVELLRSADAEVRLRALAAVQRWEEVQRGGERVPPISRLSSGGR